MRDRHRPVLASELLPAERQILETLRRLGFGRFELLQIRHGEIVLGPQRTVVRVLTLSVTQRTPVEPERK